MLEINNLYKSYGKLEVLTNLNLKLEENKIYGLFGRNGAGKTTLLNLISSQIIRNSGEILLSGEEVFENPKTMEDICLAKELPISIHERKVKEIFSLAKIIYKNWDEDYKDYLIKEFNLNTKKKLYKLSTGNQTIVGLIIGLASRSKLTMFDEPTLGLDAAARDKFYSLLLEDYEKNPRTIIISTHLIDEVANLFEEIIILNDGKIMLKSEVNKLKEKSYYLIGSDNVLLPLIKDKNIVYKEELGSTKIIGIYDNLTTLDLKYIKDNNIEMNKIPMQKLFIYLTQSIIKEDYVHEPTK